MLKKDIELKLIAIGVLLSVYWVSLPNIFGPITINKTFFNFTLFREISIVAGVGWFITLLIGLCCLSYPNSKKLNNGFKEAFKVANWVVLSILILTTSLYLIEIIFAL